MNIKNVKTNLTAALLLSVGLLNVSFANSGLINTNIFDELLNQVKTHQPVAALMSDFGTGTKVTSTGWPAYELYKSGDYTSAAPRGAECSLPPCTMVAPVNFPDGVRIIGYEINYVDWDGANNLGCVLVAVAHDFNETSMGNLGVAGFVTAGALGAASSGVLAPMTPHVVDNTSFFYVSICVQPTADTRMSSSKTYWTRVISAPPGTASFTDVPTTHQFYQDIEAMKEAGVTGGCTATTYCPNGTVTRGQMAAFISRALGL
jgi:hypothetical protein